MCRSLVRRDRSIHSLLAFALVVFTVGAYQVSAQTITEIIDSTGDGAGNVLTSPSSIAMDANGRPAQRTPGDRHWRASDCVVDNLMMIENLRWISTILSRK